jgi:peptidoglycan hydrolase CwlO-like protein
MRDIENKIENRSTELKDMQEEQKRFEDQMQKEINVCREKRAALQQDIKTKEKTMESHQREIAKVQKEIAEVSVH